MTNTWDVANRLLSSSPTEGQAVSNVYDGLGNRVSQTVGGITTTTYALDVAIGLAEVIFTSEGNAYLHLPGVMMTESADNETRYFLSDGLGFVRHVTDGTGELVTYQEFDPYGSPLTDGGKPYGYTGEWWQADIGLLHLRARWYDPQSGTFLSKDRVESEPPYLYVRGNVINRVDPSGYQGGSICNEWSGRLGLFCLEAENGNLEAIEGFYRAIVLRNRLMGLDISAAFLEHYLDGTGESVYLGDFKYDTRAWVAFGSDYQMRIYNRLYGLFFKKDVLPALHNICANLIFVEGSHSILSEPPFGRDIRGSFGKHYLSGNFKATISGHQDLFKADIKANFNIS